MLPHHAFHLRAFAILVGTIRNSMDSGLARYGLDNDPVLRARRRAVQDSLADYTRCLAKRLTDPQTRVISGSAARSTTLNNQPAEPCSCDQYGNRCTLHDERNAVYDENPS